MAQHVTLFSPRVRSRFAHATPEPRASSRATRSAGASRATVVVALALAVLILVLCDRMLRARQALVVRLLAHDVPVLVPFSEQLADYAEKKTNWNQLRATLATTTSPD